MEINSHSGAMSPITKDDFKKDRIITMKNNGSDEARTYFVTILKAKLEESNLSRDRLRPIRFRRRKNYKIFT